MEVSEGEHAKHSVHTGINMVPWDSGTDQISHRHMWACAQSISSEVKASLIAFQVFQMNAGIDRAREKEREDKCVYGMLLRPRRMICVFQH